MFIIYFWNKFLDQWAHYTLLNKALDIVTVNAGKNIKLKNAPLWVRIRLKFWRYGMFCYWTTELPLKIKTRKFRKIGIY